MMRSLTPAPCGPLLPFTLTHPALTRWFALLSPYCPNKRRPRSRSDAHARIGCSFSTVIRLDSQTTLLPPAPPTGLLLICGAFRSLTLLRSFKRRHAWLNLRGKRTTTGRINQVASLLSLSIVSLLLLLVLVVIVLLLLLLLLLLCGSLLTHPNHNSQPSTIARTHSTPTKSLRLAIHSHTFSHCHSINRVVAYRVSPSSLPSFLLRSLCLCSCLFAARSCCLPVFDCCFHSLTHTPTQQSTPARHITHASPAR